jgi:hypothetical protein
MARSEQLSFSTNALQMAFWEGNRNVGLQIKAEIAEASPEHWRLMQEEAGE